MPNVLSPRDLVSRPDIMDETVPHTRQYKCVLYLTLPHKLSGQPIQWIPRASIHRRNIQQQLQEYNFGGNSNAPDLRLLIWVMKFKNLHFVTSLILV